MYLKSDGIVNQQLIRILYGIIFLFYKFGDKNKTKITNFGIKIQITILGRLDQFRILKSYKRSPYIYNCIKLNV